MAALCVSDVRICSLLLVVVGLSVMSWQASLAVALVDNDAKKLILASVLSSWLGLVNIAQQPWQSYPA